MSPRRAGDLSPPLPVVIEALEAPGSRERRREAAALGALGELARIEIPPRGVFAPSESELYQPIEAITTRHLGFSAAMKAVRVRRSAPPELRQQRGARRARHRNHRAWSPVRALGTSVAELSRRFEGNAKRTHARNDSASVPTAKRDKSVAGRQCLSLTTDEERNIGTLQGTVPKCRPGSRQRPLLTARRRGLLSEGSVKWHSLTTERVTK